LLREGKLRRLLPYQRCCCCGGGRGSWCGWRGSGLGFRCLGASRKAVLGSEASAEMEKEQEMGLRALKLSCPFDGVVMLLCD